MILRAPLEWPEGTPRKSRNDRTSGRFRSEDWPVTVPAAINRLDYELTRFTASNAELSAGFGETRAGNIAREWKSSDPGCCVRYDVGKEVYTLPCDTYDDLAQNIAAIAAHLEAVRAIERFGVATMTQVMASFAALPPPSGLVTFGAAPAEDWWMVFGVQRTSPEAVVTAAYRALARSAHPDTGGTTAAMSRLTAAYEAFKQEREL